MNIGTKNLSPVSFEQGGEDTVFVTFEQEGGDIILRYCWTWNEDIIVVTSEQEGEEPIPSYFWAMSRRHNFLLLFNREGKTSSFVTF